MSTAQDWASTALHTTVPQLFSRNATKFPNAPALTDTAGERTRNWTWEQAHTQASILTAGLAALGLRPGQTMLVMMPNRAEHWLADLAATQLGAVPSALYTTSSSGRVRAIARHSRARVAVLHNAEQVRRCAAALRELTALEHVVILDKEAIPLEDPRFLSWEALHSLGERTLAENPSIVNQHAQVITPSHPATILYPEQATLDPKGVVLTHRNVGYAAAALHNLTRSPPQTPLLSHLPLAHIAERITSIYTAIHKAAHVHFCSGPSAVAATLPQVRPHSFFAVPRVWEKLAAPWHNLPAEQRSKPEIQQRIRAQLGLDRASWPATGSAPLGSDVRGFFSSLGIDIMQTWGLTETSGCATTNPPSRARTGTVGRAMPGVEIRTTEDGEVLVRGPIVCAGYLQHDGMIRPVTDAAGWLHTGEIGSIDEDGFLTISDRKEELITSPDGTVIAPSAVESALKAHPLIGHALAFGNQRPYLVALLVLDEEAAPTWAQEHEIEFSTLADLASNPTVQSEVESAVCAANRCLNAAEQVRRYRLLDRCWGTGWELTPTFELRRQALHDRYATVLESLYD